jgi:hypothetical protein
MNKKIFLMSGFMAFAFVASIAVLPTAHASTGTTTWTGTVTWTGTNLWIRKVKKQLKKEKKEEKVEKKDAWKELRSDFLSGLDATTIYAIKGISGPIKVQIKAIKNDSTKTFQAKEVLIKNLHIAMHAQISAILPQNLKAQFNTLTGEKLSLWTEFVNTKAALKWEWDDAKDEWKDKKWENKKDSKKANYKNLVKKVFDLSGTMAKLEDNNTSAKSIEIYNKLILKITQKIANPETDLPLKTYLQSVLNTLTQKVAALVAESD